MATDVNQAPGQAIPEKSSEEKAVVTAQQFWAKNSKAILIGLTVVVVLAGGYLAYNNLYKAPNEEKASDAMWKAENLFRVDSFSLALKGDGINAGFLKVIDKYGST